MTDLSEFMDGALYDAEHGKGLSQVAAGALRLASGTVGPVLDLACGTGGVALALARAGRKVTGVDLSGPMLDHARTKAGAGAVTWVQADIRTFQATQRFGLILLTGNAVQAMLTDSDQEALFASVRAHLTPGGLFAFDTCDPGKLGWRTNPGRNGAASAIPPERWSVSRDREAGTQPPG